MINNSNVTLLFVCIINLFLGVLFYLKGTTQSYTDLSSDQLNIIPMCLKLDNPSLYKNDLFLDKVDNFKYYTPFFVQPLRFVKNGLDINYYQTVNILHSITHVLFGVSWFLLFYFVTGKKFFISLFMSILIRGIIWLPGMELWGISEIWTFMPRTVYIAFMPIPFLLLFTNLKYKIFFSAILSGILFNFHPITGLGGILIFLVTLLYLQHNKVVQLSYAHLLACIGGVLMGMMPFISTYFLKTDIVSNYDLNLYNQAFNSRIPSYFSNGFKFVAKWFHFKTLFIIIPISLLYILPLFFKIKFEYRGFILILFSTLFILPVSSIWIEDMFNTVFELHIRMSFQLVRIQKLVILTGYLSIAYLLVKCYSYSRLSKKIVFLMLVYLVVIPFSNSRFFQQIPFISDDLTKMILPNFNTNETDHALLEIGNYIEENTPKEAVFYNSTILRTISKRSVRLDKKGASILIEGNPSKLIAWHEALIHLKQLKNENEKTNYLLSLGVDYILSEKALHLNEIKKVGKYTLYKI